MVCWPDLAPTSHTMSPGPNNDDKRTALFCGFVFKVTDYPMPRFTLGGMGRARLDPEAFWSKAQDLECCLIRPGCPGAGGLSNRHDNIFCLPCKACALSCAINLDLGALVNYVDVFIFCLLRARSKFGLEIKGSEVDVNNCHVPPTALSGIFKGSLKE